MSTYAQTQTRIAAELGRADQTTAIQEAIQSAILHYQRRFQLFAQDSQNINTVAGTAEYSLDTDFLAFERVEITVGTDVYDLTLADYDVLKSDDVSGHRGEPRKYAYRNSKIRLFPVPMAVYVVTVYYMNKTAAPSADGDNTAWTNAFLDVIRHRAKWDIQAHKLRNDAAAAASKAAEMETLSAAIAERDRLLLAGPIPATEF